MSHDKSETFEIVQQSYRDVIATKVTFVRNAHETIFIHKFMTFISRISQTRMTEEDFYYPAASYSQIIVCRITVVRYLKLAPCQSPIP